MFDPKKNKMFYHELSYDVVDNNRRKILANYCFIVQILFYLFTIKMLKDVYFYTSCEESCEL